MNEETSGQVPKGPIASASPGLAVRALGWADTLLLRGWRLFTSLKFGIFLLALIGIAAIYGTMGYASNAALGDNGIPMARAQFFESKGFVALILLFAMNLIFSTWHVTVMSCSIWWKKEFRRIAEYYSHGSSPRAEIRLPGGPDEATAILKRHFTKVHRDGCAFFAHRGLLSRLGPTIVHIGMLTIIFSVVAKAVLIWNDAIVTEGRFLAAEGESTNILHEPLDLAQQITDRNRRERDLGLWIKVLDFDEIRHPNSMTPAYFSSLVEVRDPVTQQVTVAQLDMNHSLKLQTRLGALQFHQAGYQAVPDTDFQRINFDVRDRRTGERIAVTDNHAGNRVRVGDTDLFLEVDGIAPADRWRLFKNAAPNTPYAEGLLTGGTKLKYSFKPVQFFSHFVVDETTKAPKNESPEIVNPALEVAVFLDDRQVETTWLFADRELAALMPANHPRFRLDLRDVRFLQDKDPKTVQWNEPGEALYEIALVDRNSGEELGTELLGIGETSRSHEYTTTIDHGAVDSAAATVSSDYEVRILGPTQRYMTVLSVVNEPTVPFINLGVLIIVIGAMMTFIFRYSALYALWDEKSNTMHLKLVPRWGQSPVQELFDKIVHELSHGTGPIVQSTAGTQENDEMAPAHETVNPSLAKA